MMMPECSTYLIDAHANIHSTLIYHLKVIRTDYVATSDAKSWIQAVFPFADAHANASRPIESRA